VQAGAKTYGILEYHWIFSF